MDVKELMKHAIEAAQRGIALGQSPFGCAIAREDQLLVAAHNTVLSSVDITAHAEVNALRAACEKRGEILLDDCIVATTCEPCPMCMAALHWARVESVHFGATIADAALAGFNELHISADELLRLGSSRVSLVGDVMREDCAQLFDDWLRSSSRRVY